MLQKPEKGTGVEPQHTTAEDKQFKLTGETLYGGKGKRSSLIINHCDSEPHFCDHAEDHTRREPTEDARMAEREPFTGLKQPRLLATDTIVLGEDKTLMQQENKQQHQALWAAQPIVSPWTQYQGRMDSESPTNHAACPPHCNSMCPVGRALQHPAADLLTEWATFGCPTKTGQPWSKSKIWEAVAWGPHRSALSPEAIVHFAAKAAKKVQTKQARLVQWDNIKDNPPKELKISPIAAILHKSKDF